jgi:hypothetical protein
LRRCTVVISLGLRGGYRMTGISVCLARASIASPTNDIGRYTRRSSNPRMVKDAAFDAINWSQGLCPSFEQFYSSTFERATLLILASASLPAMTMQLPTHHQQISDAAKMLARVDRCKLCSGTTGLAVGHASCAEIERSFTNACISEAGRAHEYEAKVRHHAIIAVIDRT